jgi:hypothetical protein
MFWLSMVGVVVLLLLFLTCRISVRHGWDDFLGKEIWIFKKYELTETMATTKKKSSVAGGENVPDATESSAFSSVEFTSLRS